MGIIQKNLTLKAKARGFHLITQEILQALHFELPVKTGICHIFIQHTSASLTINENADPTVRMDFEMFFNKAIPERDPDYLHDYEGDDDMPAHLKASVLGSSVTIPITEGKFALGIWQGIYLCEHRDHGDARRLVVTIMGE